ncbi:MAG: carboxypeptidase regulatory-like domain-containing protein [Chloroflexota bacterium]
MMPNLQGNVSGADGRPIGRASIRVIGDAESLGTDGRAASNAPTDVTWTRRITGFSSHRWAAWVEFVRDQVAGITWFEFVNQVVEYNPSLPSTGWTFQVDRTYLMPENPPAPDEIVWDRRLVNYFGNRWLVWAEFVSNKVNGLDWPTFASEVAVQNPHLSQDGYIFLRHKEYLLPRNVSQNEYVVNTRSNSSGAYRIADLPIGTYRIEVQAEEYHDLTQSLNLSQNQVLDLVMEPLIIGPALDFISVEGRRFILKGEEFRFVGANIRGIVHYGDPQVLSFASKPQQREQLVAANAVGFRVIRLFLAAKSVSTGETINRLRELIGLIKQNFPAIYLLPAFTDFYNNTPFHPQGDDDFYNQSSGGFSVLNPSWFEGGFRQNYLPFVEQVVEAFKNEPQIMAWELGNELKVDNQPDLFTTFNHQVAAAIRAIDTNHLITTGMISTRQAYMSTQQQKRKLYANANLDFITNHAYNGENLEDDSALSILVNKPFIVEEAGFDAERGQDRSDWVQNDMDKWFARAARGYIQWGFMATDFDNGDGDRKSGMDRQFHDDYDQLARVYRERAQAL